MNPTAQDVKYYTDNKNFDINQIHLDEELTSINCPLGDQACNLKIQIDIAVGEVLADFMAFEKDLATLNNSKNTVESVTHAVAQFIEMHWTDHRGFRLCTSWERNKHAPGFVYIQHGPVNK